MLEDMGKVPRLEFSLKVTNLRGRGDIKWSLKYCPKIHGLDQGRMYKFEIHKWIDGI